MTTTFRSLTVVLALSAFTVASAQTNPQTGTTKETPAKKETTTTTTSSSSTTTTQDMRAANATRTWAPLDVERMQTELGLTEEQVTKLRDLDARYNKMHTDLSADAKATPADRTGKVTSMMQARDNELRQILTKEQFMKWESMSAGKTKPAAAGSMEKTK